MRIFVPTRKRIPYQKTMERFFLDHIPYHVTYITPESEAELFRRAWPGRDVISVPDSFRLSDIRQWLVDNHREPDPFHVCVDDDLRFFRRETPHSVKLLMGTKQDAIDCFTRIEQKWLRLFAHGSVSIRGGNNNQPNDHQIIGRSMQCHFYDARVLHGEGIRIDAVVLRQDFHTTLSLLELGYPNVIDFEFACGQDTGSKMPGGCQVYRTLELMDEQARVLADLHPDFVTIVVKEKPRFGLATDVRMSWQKAFGARIGERKLPMDHYAL